MKKSFLRKVFTFISVFSIIAQSLTPYAVLIPQQAFAQEVTPTVTENSTTTNDTQTAIEQTTPAQTDAVAPTSILTPTPTETPVPSDPVSETPIPTPNDPVSLTPTSADNLSPPADNSTSASTDTSAQTQNQSETLAPEPTVLPTPPAPQTATENPKDEQLNIIVLDNVSAPSIDLEAVEEQGSAVLSTDKPDYAPTDTALITGSNLLPNTTYSLRIWSDDEPATSTTVEVTSDENGVFAYAYQLDGTYRPNYSAELKDSTGTVVATVTFTDSNNNLGNPSADLDQCANGGVGNPPVNCTGSAWQNGNLNSNQAHYLEGQFVPYRMRFDNLSTSGSNTITIGWDTTKSGKHAIDYLGSYNATESTGNNPCSGVGGCSLASFDTESIPTDTNVTNGQNGIPGGGDDISQIPGVFTLFGGNITSVSGYTLIGPYSGDSETRVTITFTAAVDNPVLAWGGHIATRFDWGAGNSAINISGSPYHMRNRGLNGGGGNQDRSLSAGAVVFPASITVLKNSLPDDAQDFVFTTTGTGLSGFTLDDNGNNADGTSNTKVFSVTDFGTKTITESVTTGWSLTGLSCSVTGTGSQSTNLGTRTATLTVEEGDIFSCTYINTQQQGNINIVKNTIGGNDTFGFTISGPSSSTPSITTSGGTGTTGNIAVTAGSGYSVTENTPPTGWTQTNVVCNNGTQNVTNTNFSVAAAGTVTCTFTNTKQATVVVQKNTTGGDGTFGFTSTGANGLPASFNVSTTTRSGSQTYTVTPGVAYSVSETVPSGWSLTSSSCTSGTPASFTPTAGETVTCTFNNTKKGHIIVDKITDPSQDTQSFTFTTTGTGYNGFSLTDQAAPNDQELVPGTYSVAETVPSGWTQTSAVCDNQQTPESISLQAGQTVTCAFTNTRDTGTITILKNVDNNNDGDVTDQSDVQGATDWTWDIANGEQNIATGQSTNLVTGNYTITEDVKANYHIVGWTCTDQTSGSTNSIPVNLASNGQSITCTITNARDTGTVVVHKDVQGPAGENVTDTANNFTVQLNSTNPKTITDNESVTYNNVPTGSHTVTESVIPSGYTLYGISETQGGSGNTNGLSVNVTTGQTTHVYVTNRQQKATITVVKNVVAPNGTTDVSDNHAFTAQLNGGDEQSFSEATTATYLVNPGNYSITELSDNNYDYVSCTPDSNQTAGDGAQVTVGSNGSVNVTCTNKQKNAQVTVVKDVRDPNGADVTDNTNFTVQRDGSGTEDKTFREGFNAAYTLAPGTYTFTELVTAGYTLNNINPDNDADALNGTTVTLSSGQNQTITFMNYQDVGSISGQKLGDTDGDLNTTVDQSNLTNWTINLLKCASNFTGCVLSATTTTNGSGYSFLNVIPGFYQIQEVLQSGWTNLTSLFQNLTVGPGETKTSVNFVNFQNVSVTACKKVDADGDIATTGDQTNKSGWTVNLLTNGQTTDTQTTDENGCYTWTDLGPNYTYGVSEDTPSGWTSLNNTTKDFGSAQGGSDYTYTFVNFENVSISGQKWNDLNGDGIWDDGEPALENWIIYLSGASSDSDTTDTNGEYSFPNLGPGTYTLSETLQTGWTQTYPTNPNTHSVTVTSGQNVEDKNFGNFRLGQIYGFKYEDTNGNGEFDFGEPKLNGWEICLNNEDWEGKECVDTYDSEDYGDGYFEFTGLEYGNYELTEDETNPDYQQTQPESGSYNILIESGSGFGEGDARYFGNAPLTDIYGFKWNDENGDGQRDEGENLLGGWTIFLDENGDGQLNGEEKWTTTEDNFQSDNFGRYRFSYLFPGEYSICEVQQSGWAQTYPTNDSDEPTCYAITLPEDGEESRYNFGNQLQTPILTISKRNFAVGNQAPGNTVNFEITISADEEGGPADNVKVVDLLPQGFVFNPGSWKVVSSDISRGVSGDITSLLTAPTYASPGIWSLGHMNSGETLTLTYTATIDGSQATGTYYDNAWAQGNPVGNSTIIFARAINPGDLDPSLDPSEFVGTEVAVVNPNQAGVDYKATSRKEVLGAETGPELPATGEPTLWVIIATLLGGLGFGTLILGLRLRRRYE